MAITNLKRKLRRQKRVRAKIVGVSSYPRVSVHRSNKYIYAQVIDDSVAKTLATATSMKVKGESTKVQDAKAVGMELAEKLKKLNIIKVVFDRGGFIYKGRVKALAEGLREGGIEV